MVRVLPSYERDYLPVFQEQTTYIRGRGRVQTEGQPFGQSMSFFIASLKAIIFALCLLTTVMVIHLQLVIYRRWHNSGFMSHKAHGKEMQVALFVGGFGHKDENFVEYDLDASDREWLEKFNKGQDRLPARRFELLIWRLELINAEVNERQTAATGFFCLLPT